MAITTIRNRSGMTGSVTLSWDQNGIEPGDAIDFSDVFVVGTVDARAFHWMRDSSGQTFDRLSRIKNPPRLGGTCISTILGGTRHEPLEIRFEDADGNPASVHGAGTEILAGTRGRFTAVIRVFNAAETELAKAEATSNPNGDPLFLGLLSTTKTIAKVTIDTKKVDSNGLRINDVAVVI